MARGVVECGGAVVIRKRGGRREVLLVHRPKYDDWSWPKGKRDPGEHLTTTTVREVLEETGVEVRLGRPLPWQRYAVSGGREKVVHYWLARPVGDDDVSAYPANAEIDVVRWVPVERARRLLTYTDDQATLDHALEEPRRTHALVVLRHAHALPRGSWEGEDHARPLRPDGEAQAVSLVDPLRAYAVSWVLSSSARRCVHTVKPYAKDQVLPVQRLTELSEERYDSRVVKQLLDTLLSTRESVMVCSHRPLLPEILDRLGVQEEPLAPGEWVVAHHRKGRLVATERHRAEPYRA